MTSVTDAIAVGAAMYSTGKRTKAASRVFGEALFDEEEQMTTVAEASLCYSSSPSSTRSSSGTSSSMSIRKSNSSNSSSTSHNNNNDSSIISSTIAQDDEKESTVVFEKDNNLDGFSSKMAAPSVVKDTDMSFASSNSEKENTNNFVPSAKPVSVVASTKNPFASATGIQKLRDEELRRLRATKKSPMRQQLMKRAEQSLKMASANSFGPTRSLEFRDGNTAMGGLGKTSGGVVTKISNRTSNPPNNSKPRLASALKKSSSVARAGSVNHTVNASRKAKSSILRDKRQAVKSVRFQWQQEISETKQLNEKVEQNRRQIRTIQKKLSSAHFREKARKDESKKFERLAKLEEEYVFKSNVYSDHQKRRKAEEDARRRQSIAVRAKIRQNKRDGSEKLRMIKMEEEQANFEVSADLHKARMEAAKAKAEDRRKSFQFRAGDARKIRNMRENWRAQELQAQHESFELKRAAAKDVEEYKRQMQARDRDDKRSRNLEARERREFESESAHSAMLAEHKSYELKWDGERDAEAYKKKLQEERRKSLAGRNKESARHATVMKELRSLAKQKEADDYMLKWGGENDVKDYLSQMAEERRKSLQQRAIEAWKARKHEEDEHAQAIQESLKDMVLKSECQKDVDNYKAECAERDRKSLQYRGKQLQLQHLEEEKRRIEQLKVDEENANLETLARKDVEEYYEDCQKRRRKSLAWRAKERRRNFEWKRKTEEDKVQERSHTSHLHSLDMKHMALAQEEERAQKAMDALRRAGCTFHGNPFLDL
mmetsp:Transcript_9168/g.23220  ORF Transcript_9168/g.23220 Transcript_9168/m.23220 type:complete len:772 (+) Transcript_9168:255-2570(+)